MCRMVWTSGRKRADPSVNGILLFSVLSIQCFMCRNAVILFICFSQFVRAAKQIQFEQRPLNLILNTVWVSCTIRNNTMSFVAWRIVFFFLSIKTKKKKRNQQNLAKYSFVTFKSIAGGFNSRTLPVIFTAVQSKWACFSGNLYTNCDARDQRVHCAGCHECIHHNPFNGHENNAHGQKVSNVTRSWTQHKFTLIKMLEVN